MWRPRLYQPPAGAIQVLLISDSLFRINHIEKRRKYAELIEGVREAGGEALVGAIAAYLYDT